MGWYLLLNPRLVAYFARDLPLRSKNPGPTCRYVERERRFSRFKRISTWMELAMVNSQRTQILNSAMEPSQSVCVNGHEVAELVNVDGALRCPECAGKLKY